MLSVQGVVFSFCKRFAFKDLLENSGFELQSSRFRVDIIGLGLMFRLTGATMLGLIATDLFNGG